jgi:hypothetical protein
MVEGHNFRQMNNLFLLLLLSSCALVKPAPPLSDTAKQTPPWIYSPYDECGQERELCATGEARTLAQADAEARKNLASIFEVKVTSEFSAETTTTQSFPWQGAVREEVRRSLQESVDQILETVEIKKHHREKGLTYSLAALDRAKASELVLGRLTKLDDELGVLWQKRNRTNLRRIVRLYLERDKLNERYSIVSGAPKPGSVTWKELTEWRASKARPEALALRIGQAPEWLTEKLRELLSEAGFRLVKGDAYKAVSVNVDSIKEYLNVSGFEKYTFTLNVTSFERGEKRKVLAVSETVTGRTQADALLKIRHYFTEYVEQHLADLDLD